MLAARGQTFSRRVEELPNRFGTTLREKLQRKRESRAADRHSIGWTPWHNRTIEADHRGSAHVPETRNTSRDAKDMLVADPRKVTIDQRESRKKIIER